MSRSKLNPLICQLSLHLPPCFQRFIAAEDRSTPGHSYFTFRARVYLARSRRFVFILQRAEIGTVDFTLFYRKRFPTVRHVLRASFLRFKSSLMELACMTRRFVLADICTHVSLRLSRIQRHSSNGWTITMRLNTRRNRVIEYMRYDTLII